MYLLAALSAFLAVPALLLSGYFGALFFLGRGERYGPLNDVFAAVVLFLMVLPAIAVNDLAGGQAGAWFEVVTWLAVAGMAVGGAGQVLLVAGVISLQTSFVTGGAGIAPVLAWMAALAVTSIRHGDPAPLVGWLTVLSLALMAPIALTPLLRTTMKAKLSIAGVLALALVAWLLALGVNLLFNA